MLAVVSADRWMRHKVAVLADERVRHTVAASVHRWAQHMAVALEAAFEL